MKKLSLRLRLIIYFIGLSCIIWGVAGALSWKETRESVDEFFDTSQMVLARQLAGADWGSMVPDSQKITNQLIKNIHNAEDDDESIGFAVFDKDGKRIFHDNEDGKNIMFAPQVGHFVTQPVDGEDWRLVWISSSDGAYVIAVGQELEYREDIVWDMLEEFMTPWAAGLFVLLVMIVAILTAEFRSMGGLAESLKKRQSGDLSPLNEAGIPSEVLPLVGSMNALLAQIETMLSRERSFIADAAHELRTPLTALKIQLELAQMAGEDVKMREDALQKLQLGIERSARLVEQLLALSRIESSLVSAEMSEDVLDWHKSVAALVEEYQSEADAKNIKLVFEVGGHGPVERGNPVLWALLLRNLIDNALKYTPSGEVVRIVVGDGQVAVTNSGVTVDEAVLSRLSERFFRPAGQKQSGSGLGLSIVKCISDFYGVRLMFDNCAEGFRAVVAQ